MRRDPVVGLPTAARACQRALTTPDGLSNIAARLVRAYGGRTFRSVMGEVARRLVAVTKHQHHAQGTVLTGAGRPHLSRTFVNPMPFKWAMTFELGELAYRCGSGGPITDLEITVVGAPPARPSSGSRGRRSEPALYDQKDLQGVPLRSPACSTGSSTPQTVR